MNVTKQLYQWDTGQKLTECTGIYVDYLISDEVYRVEIIDGTCIIPDELLQTSGRYKVWECMADNTLREFAFKVLPRPIPPNYVFTPTEQLTFEGLVQKETNKFNTNAIEKLNAYNANADNRVAEFNAQTEQIQADVSELKSDLTSETNARANADNDLSARITNKVAQPLDGNNQPTNGTSGQSLRTKGDGTTEWASVGLPTDAQTADAVSAWLDEHPEATTTVQDGSITKAKLNASLSNNLIIYVSNLGELTSALNNGNRIIAFKEGTSIEVSATVKIPNGTTIIGNGATFTRVAGFEGKMLNVGTDCNISNLRINGNRSAMVNPSWDTTIEMSLFGFCTLENCVFEHGNECVIAYNDCNRIMHCKFTDCGGNAIHFSGGKYTVVDGCFVNGANKRSGMGHENGCIIWSSECAYATCVNNYCEDGKSGFGRIGSEHAGFVKIIGNTVKNCTYACEVGNTASGTVPAHEVIIANNLFMNCTRINIYKTSNQTCDLSRVTITGNDLVNVAIIADRATNLLIANNNIRGDIAQVSMSLCASSIVSNNIINNTANMTRALLVYLCNNVSINGNYIRGGKEAILCSSSTNVVFDANVVSAYCPATTDVAIGTPSRVTMRNNTVYSFGKGINAGSGAQVIGNQFWLTEDVNAINTFGGTTNVIIAHNMTNKTNSLSADSATYVNQGNITNVTADCFASVTTNLTNITSDSFTSVVLGDDFICNLTADDGYALPDTITVSVADITVPYSECFYDKTSGRVEVYGVRGAVVITASGVV